MISATLRLGHQTPQEILVAYMCAGRTVDDGCPELAIQIVPIT